VGERHVSAREQNEALLPHVLYLCHDGPDHDRDYHFSALGQRCQARKKMFNPLWERIFVDVPMIVGLALVGLALKLQNDEHDRGGAAHHSVPSPGWRSGATH